MLQDLSSKSAVKPKPSTRTLSFRSRCSANQSHKTCHATYGALQNKYTAYTSGFVSTASYVLAPKEKCCKMQCFVTPCCENTRQTPTGHARHLQSC